MKDLIFYDIDDKRPPLTKEERGKLTNTVVSSPNESFTSKLASWLDLQVEDTFPLSREICKEYLCDANEVILIETKEFSGENRMKAALEDLRAKFIDFVKKTGTDCRMILRIITGRNKPITIDEISELSSFVNQIMCDLNFTLGSSDTLTDGLFIRMAVNHKMTKFVTETLPYNNHL